jgi:hypothetical protein
MSMTENTRRPATINRRDGRARSAVILLAALTVLLMTAAVASAWFFKQVENKYSMLVALTATDLNGIHDISYHSGISYAHLLELLSEPEPAKQAPLLQTIAAERAANDQVFNDLRRSITDSRIRSGFDELVAKRQVFRESANAFIGESGKNGALEDRAALSRRLLQAFEEYQDSCDKLGDLIQANALQVSAQVSAQIGWLRLLYFSLALLPMVLAFILMLLTLWLLWGMPVEVDLRDAYSRGDFTARTRDGVAPVAPGAALIESRTEPGNAVGRE